MAQEGSELTGGIAVFGLSSAISGHLGTYSIDGYMVNVTKDSVAAKNVLEDLRDSRFVDKALSFGILPFLFEQGTFGIQYVPS